MKKITNILSIILITAFAFTSCELTDSDIDPFATSACVHHLKVNDLEYCQNTWVDYCQSDGDHEEVTPYDEKKCEEIGFTVQDPSGRWIKED